MNTHIHTTPIGPIEIHVTDGYITRLEFCSEKELSSTASVSIDRSGTTDKTNDITDTIDTTTDTKLIQKACKELDEYFQKKRRTFSVPLKPKGTAFQQNVWQALIDIDYGTTKTYKEIAENVGRPKAFRAVGMACNKNPIPIFIPCHRVIGSNGKLVGYAGGVEVKERLIRYEAGGSR